MANKNDNHGSARKALKITGITLKVIVTVLAGLLLVYNIYVLIARYAFGVGMPPVFGYAVAYVTSGSMSPEIEKGDFIVLKAQSDYTERDIVTYYNASVGEYITHRIIYKAESGYVTRGDANNIQDNITVTNDMIVGKVVAVANGLGNLISFLRSPAGLMTALAVCVGVWAAAEYLPRLIFRPHGEDNGGADGTSGSSGEGTGNGKKDG